MKTAGFTVCVLRLRFVATAMAAMMTGLLWVSVIRPVAAAELRMQVSVTILSRCAMQLDNVAPASIGSAAPFSARCNTPTAPRLQYAAMQATAVNSSLADKLLATFDGAHTQSEVFSVYEGERQVIQYVRYTIEY